MARRSGWGRGWRAGRSRPGALGEERGGAGTGGRERGGGRACGVGERREEGRGKEREKKRKEKENGKKEKKKKRRGERREKGEREGGIRAGITALIAEPVGHAWRPGARERDARARGETGMGPREIWMPARFLGVTGI